MAITYPLTLPTTPSFKTLTIMPESAIGRNTSPFTLKEQLYKHDGDRWVLSAGYPPLNSAQAKIMRAFLIKLDNGVGTFYAGDPNNRTPGGTVSGSVTVSGGGQTGRTLAVTGIPSQANWFRAGDDIQVGNYLYTVLLDANVNGSGVCTLDIFPKLRVSPANGDAVVYSSPKGLFRLREADVSWSTDIEGLYDINFSAVEAL